MARHSVTINGTLSTLDVGSIVYVDSIESSLVVRAITPKTVIGQHVNSPVWLEVRHEKITGVFECEGGLINE